MDYNFGTPEQEMAYEESILRALGLQQKTKDVCKCDDCPKSWATEEQLLWLKAQLDET